MEKVSRPKNYKPVNEPVIPIDYKRRFTLQEIEKMSFGKSASSIDEKWIAFRQEDTFVFCRSWTCMTVATLTINKVGDLYETTSLAIAEELINEVYTREMIVMAIDVIISGMLKSLDER